MYEAVIQEWDGARKIHATVEGCGHSHRNILDADVCVGRLAGERFQAAKLYDLVKVQRVDLEPLDTAAITALAERYKRSPEASA